MNFRVVSLYIVLYLCVRARFCCVVIVHVSLPEAYLIIVLFLYLKFGLNISVIPVKKSRLFARLLFALEGNYLEANSQSVEHTDGPEGHGVQCLNFSCSIPAINGRGFIEVVT